MTTWDVENPGNTLGYVALSTPVSTQIKELLFFLLSSFLSSEASKDVERLLRLTKKGLFQTKGPGCFQWRLRQLRPLPITCQKSDVRLYQRDICFLIDQNLPEAEASSRLRHRLVAHDTGSWSVSPNCHDDWQPTNELHRLPVDHSNFSTRSLKFCLLDCVSGMDWGLASTSTNRAENVSESHYELWNLKRISRSIILHDSTTITTTLRENKQDDEPTNHSRISSNYVILPGAKKDTTKLWQLSNDEIFERWYYRDNNKGSDSS
jgi:hypothetical protein